MSSSQKAPFRVIVVGGGVGGLTAAHTFHRANIDYVILEKGVIAPPMGASIGIYPQGSRILDQIGCLKSVEAECYPLGKSINILPNGKIIANSDFFAHSRNYHGYPIPVLERRRFLEILYEQLPDKSKVRTKAGVVDIIDGVDGVKVLLEDGSIEEGDLVIGCDGVHSAVRSLMWRNANAKIPGYITTTEKKSLFCDWTALVGLSPTLPGMSNCDMTCTHYPGRSFLVIGQKTYTFWFVFFKNPQRLHWPSRPRWSDADAAERARECADCPISSTQVFGELWKTRIRGELVNVEEGLFDHAYFGRVVLAGDAVHKMTPNVGLGGNSAMESIVLLSNLLNRAIQVHPGGRPDAKLVEQVLSEYQSLTKERMRKIIDFSNLATRIQAWDTPFHKLLSRVVPFLPDTTFAKQAAQLIKASRKLEYVQLPKRDVTGTMPWDDELQLAPNDSKVNKGVTSFSFLYTPLVGLFVAISFLFLSSLISA
ncbi:FAD-dependent monooxygenase [Penicillium verhagenii]|uniref:FAD-dependent monooxygenase n=1 Tax=Penicillium verhagenii TaxID=1562060 RepID=UPI0025453635|nr:FAD-dependent monooxygenase [Penicillium verhagenii]KAJ5918466.1 FAD-dependent monooxygenase [Penicillium verhagenii]